MEPMTQRASGRDSQDKLGSFAQNTISNRMKVNINNQVIFEEND